MGQLKYGTYDDCLDLIEEEVNAFYGFDQNGESFSINEEYDKEESDHEAEESDHEVEESDHEAEESDHEDLMHDSEDGEPQTDDHFDTRVGVFLSVDMSFIDFFEQVVDNNI